MIHRVPEQRVYQCDRCGKYYAKEERYADAGHPWDDLSSTVTFTDGHRSAAHDFCGSCTNDWLMFASGQPLGDAK